MGILFDKMTKDTIQDGSKGDWNYTSVSESDYKKAANELVQEYLESDYTGQDKKAVVTPTATPDKNAWGSASGILYIPQRKSGLNLIAGGGNDFLVSLTHELGHFVYGLKAKKDYIEKLVNPIAKKAVAPAKKVKGANSKAWTEECRADLTGIMLRTIKEKKTPPLDEYNSVFDDDPGDSEHPPGDLRLTLMDELLKKL